MTIHVDLVEALWIVLNAAAVLLTLGAYLDARNDQTAIRRRNGRARTLVARGNVRRELTRLLVQVLLLGGVRRCAS